MLQKRLYDSIERRLERGANGRCTVCQRSTSPSESAVCCTRAKCRSLFELFEEKRERLRQRRQNRPGGPAERELYEHLGTEGQRLASSAGAPDSVAVALVPANPFALVPLPASRRQSFLDHLEQLLGSIQHATTAGSADEFPSSAGPYADLSVPAELEPLLGSLCGLCRGQCCTTASSHAYLAEADLLRTLRQTPEASSEELAGRYAAHFPKVSYEGSCVFHAAAGCTLPSELRSDMCNRFLCRGLKRLTHELRPTTRTVLAASTVDGAIVRKAEVDHPLRDPAQDRAAHGAGAPEPVDPEDPPV